MTLVENTVVGIAKEPTYGTYSEVGQINLHVESVTPKTDPGLAERNDITGTINRLSSVPTRKSRSTQIKMKVYPGDDIGLFLNNLFGAPTTTGAGPYTHVFDLLEANLLTKYTSLEVSEGGNTADDYDGGVAGNLTISGSNEQGSYITAETTLTHQGWVAGTLPVSYVYTDVIPYTGCMALVEHDSSPISVDNWSISIDMAFKLDNFKVDGTCEIQKPVMNGKPKVTFTFEADNIDLALRAQYIAGTSDKPVKITLTHSTIAAAETPYSLSFEMPASQIEDNNRSGDTGQLKESCTLVALPGTSENAVYTQFEAVLVNNQPTYA